MGEHRTLPPIQLREHIATGATIDARSVPYWVRGRDHETAHIMSKLGVMPCTISVIAGGPGSGKSTMLTHIAAYATYVGIRTVELRIEDFANETALTDALLAVQVADDATPNAERTTRSKSLGVDAAAATVEAKTIPNGPVSNLRPLAWKLALAELGKGEGTLILMDEMQRLGELLQQSDRTDLVCNFLEELNNGHTRYPKRRIALLGCGLSNTQYVLNRLRITQVETYQVIHLGPLSPTASRQVLHDCCNAPTQAGETLPQPPVELIEELTEISEGCARHLAWAGCRLQQQALRVAKHADRSWTMNDMAEVRQQAQQDRVALYEKCWMRQESASAKALAFALATSIPTLGRALREDVVEKLTEKLRREFQSTQDPLSTLIKHGVIEYRRGGQQFLTLDRHQPHGKHYAFPIPSMARWLREDLNETVPAWRREDSEAMFRIVVTEICDTEKVSVWQWDYDQGLALLMADMELPDTGIDATDRIRPRRVENVTNGNEFFLDSGEPAQLPASIVLPQSASSLGAPDDGSQT